MSTITSNEAFSAFNAGLREAQRTPSMTSTVGHEHREHDHGDPSEDAPRVDPPFVDLEPFINGEVEQEIPTIGSIEGGGFCIYAGRQNEIHAEPSVGKTNVELAIVKDVLEKGDDVLFIDPEDTPRGIVNRLRQFGTSPEDIRRGFHYVQDPTPEELTACIRWNETHNVKVVILDGLAEALAGFGYNEREEKDVLKFFRLYTRPFADAGAAVLISDHVVKDNDSRGRWSRGSGAKMGRYDGVSFEARLVQAYAPGVPGKVKLVVAKDRNGGVGQKGHCPAEILFEPFENGTRVRIIEPEQKGFQPSALMEKVSRAIEADPNISARSLRKLGKAEYVDLAINNLNKTGYLRVHNLGSGKKTEYTLLQAYRSESR